MAKLIIKKIMILCSIFYFSCSDQNTVDTTVSETVIINSNLYKEADSNLYTINNVSLNGNLLSIKITSSGCSGNSWKAVLIDANEILESYPVQRNIKLALENKEACLAIFEKEFTFDISALKDGFSKVILNLEGWNYAINYP